MAVDNRTNDLRQTVCGTSYYHPTGASTMSCTAIGTRHILKGMKDLRWACNPLSIQHITKYVPLLNGIQLGTGGVPQYELTDLPIGYHTVNPRDPHADVGVPSNATLQALAWEILSKTNPSRPHVSVPTFVGELRDLPQLVKGWGDGLLRSIARGNLSWRFCVRPMMGDVRKLLDFASASDKKLAQLRKLRDTKFLRTRCSLGAGTMTPTSGNALVHSAHGPIRCNARNITTWKMWGSAEWKLHPSSVLPDYSDEQLESFARRLTLGITSYGALETAWNLLPWSWLVDWYSNVGSMIQALNNTVHCTWGRIGVMRTSKTIGYFDFPPTQKPAWITFNGWFDWQHERKERWPTSPAVPFPLPSLPILDGGQWSILLSLAALRR